MPELTFEVTAKGVQVPSLDGRLFCSGRDPHREARAWFAIELPFLRGSSDVLVLGLGAGFHILEILQSDSCPDQLWVVEKQIELVDFWKKQNGQKALHCQMQFLSSDTDLEQRCFPETPILEFRPAWAGQEDFYQNLSNILRGPSVKELASKLSGQDQTRPAKIWRALRELVQ